MVKCSWCMASVVRAAPSNSSSIVDDELTQEPVVQNQATQYTTISYRSNTPVTCLGNTLPREGLTNVYVFYAK